MKPNCVSRFVLPLLVGAAVSAPIRTRAAEIPLRPNIVLILADDLGWADLGCYGADLHETPHLDQLAREGVRFSHAYAPSPVCSPTRAALLTGKHPGRLRITIWAEGSLNGPTNRVLLEAPSRPDLPHTETTLAKHLQAAGYLTALVGKWHLGNADYYPETHGFDVNIGGTRWGAPQTYFWPYRGAGGFGGEFRYVPHLEFGRPGEYLTDRLTDEALRLVDRAAKAKQPFFLYLAHHAPHTPIQAKTNDVAHFEQKLRPGLRHQNAVYAAMVRSLDDSVGRVLTDLFPTLLTAAGLPPPADSPADGLDLTALLRRPNTKLDRDALFFHYPHYYHAPPSTPASAVRAGSWKLVEYFEDNHVELYNLSDDPAEQHDLARLRPETAERLRRQLDGWRQQVGAALPTPNPHHASRD